MMRLDIERHPRLTEQVIQVALAQHLEWWNLTVIPNWCRFHEMDLAVLTRAGYLWEYEIKVSQSDWEADQRKDQPRTPDYPPVAWNRPTRDLRYVKRFYYVHTAGLTCPDWVPDWAGLLEVRQEAQRGKVYVHFTEHRAPTDRKVEKLPEDDVRRLLQSTYYKFWRLHRARFNGDGNE